VPFSVVCFRTRPPAASDNAPTDEHALDRLNERLMERVNATGEVFFSHTRLNGRFAIRMAIGNLHTSEMHVARAWALLREHATSLSRE
jgi:aromatic-L-amino-acid decarboxylase